MGVMDTSVPFLTGADGRPHRYPLNEFYHTPQMERLAAQGIRFSQFYANSVCSPSRVSLLTGQSSARHRVTNWINPKQNNSGPHGPADWRWSGLGTGDVTLPRILQSAGYRTIHVGKGHFGPSGAAGADPKAVGFDVQIGGGPFGQPGSYYGKNNYRGPAPEFANAVPHLEAYHGSDTFLTDALTLEAMKATEEAARGGQPFFLHFAQYAVHAPFDRDPRFAGRYRDSGRPGPAQSFATLIEGMDRSLGVMLDHLEKLGVASNTLVIFLGDNGTDAPLGGPHEVACAAPLRGQKGSHYEGGMRAPLMVAWAKPDPSHPQQRRLPIAAGAIQTQMASICDLFPTILGMLDLKAPEGYAVDGYRLDRMLTGAADAQHPDEFLMHYPHGPHRSSYFTILRRGDWKVIYHYRPSGDSNGARYQLFHLAQDPFEQTDLASTRPEILRRMMERMRERLERCGAQYPAGNDGKNSAPALPP
ncbi:MAG: sulfatase-like hydrolase/transferase [Kiritimatiellae bacterium]|nr:sulfatase-like hydrolase/transferase [Kiritimatiellia bacterium]